ncbi:MAG: hypothetical protein R3324_02625, partial [Halobacteriales archaeon]|nr:hypothetical protein [Halobacteriales archaeon]
KTPDEAIRYALGNHYGDHSDPIVEEPESIKGWSHYQHRIELAEAVTLIQYTKWTDEGVLIVYDSRTDADDGEPLGPFCATCGEYVELPDNLLVEHA